MKAVIHLAAPFLLTLIMATATAAQAQPAAPMLVDVDWLSQHLKDADVVLLHVGDAADFEAGHIEGARRLSDADVTTTRQHAGATLVYELPPAAELRTRLAALGVSDRSHIVVYQGKGAGVPNATRVVFTLDYLGLGGRTSLLNGGLAAWTRAGKAVTQAPARVVPGTLAAVPVRPIVAEAEAVPGLAQQRGVRLVDARAPVFYKGIEQAGHIPGAISIPFTEIADSEQLIRRERVAELFARAGVQPGDTVLAYCHIGQQATAVIFAARLLGHPVLLYDGSFTDWSRNGRGPAER